MKAEAIKEKLIYYNSFKTNVWVTLVALAGGLSGLLLNKLHNITEVVLFTLGCFWETVFIIALVISILKIRFYTNKLNEGE